MKLDARRLALLAAAEREGERLAFIHNCRDAALFIGVFAICMFLFWLIIF